MSIWIFDTETTDVEDDREIIEAAWISLGLEDDPDQIGSLRGLEYMERFNPTRPISYGSMAIHNILPSELEGCPDPLEFSIPDDVEYLVGHNIDFDWESAGSPVVRRIDTLAMARHIWPDVSHSQSALVYMVNGPTEETRDMLKNAHSALDDVRNNAVLLTAILRVKADIKTWSSLWAYSEECRIPITCPLGKHKGTKLDALARLDRGYCEWLLRQDWLDPYLRIGVRRAMGFE